MTYVGLNYKCMARNKGGQTRVSLQYKRQYQDSLPANSKIPDVRAPRTFKNGGELNRIGSLFLHGSQPGVAN